MLELNRPRILESIKARKTVYLIAAYLVLLFCLRLFTNPYQFSVDDNVWYWILGLLSLAYLAYVEKQRNIPFRFVDRVEPKWFYGGYCVIAVCASVIIVRLFLVMFHLSGIPVYSIVVHSGNDVFGIVGYAIVVAIDEESFKVALTNFCTKILGTRGKKIEGLTIKITGTLSVALWAYLHVLVGHHSTGYAMIAFAVGIVYFLIILYLKNYLPTTAAHAIWNVAIDFGFL